ncbi:hypothetical protein [Parvicella tangerina]|uniref:CcmD family protein n=1 Tax=Parvicella tangerina TaxID=2829795 RepID=A0A916JPS4_9FLAO|nr:hypothetical protein [Parvicella tangerina]CAG5083415.1 hypothetical protein CRYO30217_02190 [Parvicella tangerina]
MQRILLTLIISLFSIATFAQEPNIAAIVDEKTREVDVIFVSKILVMLFLGIIAFLSYLKFRKTEP